MSVDAYTLRGWAELEVLLAAGHRVDAAHAVLTDALTAACGPGWAPAVMEVLAADGGPTDPGRLLDDEVLAGLVLDRLRRMTAAGPPWFGWSADEPGPRPLGTLDGIAVHPVAGMAATPAFSADVGPAGLAGDRGRVVVDVATGERVRGKHAPGLAQVVPSGDDAADADLASRVLGRPVRVEVAAEPAVMVAAVHLVSRQALATGPDPRANLALDLPGGDDERDWVGRELTVGPVRLRITRTPRHCLGVYAETLVPGRVRVGDVVELG